MLDMRKDPNNQTVTAADLIAAGSEMELSRIFWELGEETAGGAIAREIIRRRTIEPIITTQQLANIILSVRKRGKGDRTHPATRTFQALRIAVNDELETLKTGLESTLNVLRPEGRLVVISFHSLEDRIVKDFLKDNISYLKILTDKPIGPTKTEVEANPRSRSGKLRAAQKLSTS
jgi:16S rRNA (cytosine1402-N4)-methyltransferase